MGEGAEDLSPDDAEVAQALVRDFGEDAVEDVAEEMAGEARHDRLTAPVAERTLSVRSGICVERTANLLVIRDPAESE